MQRQRNRTIGALGVAFSATIFALCEPSALNALSTRMGSTLQLLPTGAAFAIDSDNDGYPKNTDGFYLYPAEDCNDVNANAHPLAAEACNGLVDDDCNGCRDEGCPDGMGGNRPTFCDGDNDGFLTPNDCNNLNASINPGATEICNNGFDDNCNGAVDAADTRCQAPPNLTGVSWHVLNGPQSICLLNPSIHPDLITIPGPVPGCLPAANSGTRAWWFGGDARGSFLGDEAPLPQDSKTGGTSVVGKLGTLTTPSFPATSAEGRVQFYAWREIESQNPSGFDLMEIVAIDVAGNETRIVKLNPLTDPPWHASDRHYASGYNAFLNESAVPTDPFANPVWKLYTVALPAGTVRVKFSFSAVDGFYNGFRGWLIDDVQVNDILLPVLSGQQSQIVASSGMETSLFTDDIEGDTSGWETSTTLFFPEICGNCQDDDGDDLIDMLDPDCGAPAALSLKSAGLSLKPDPDEDQMTLQGSFVSAGVSIDPLSEGVTVGVLDPTDPHKKIACLRIPANSLGWTLKKGTWTFKDKKDNSLGDPTAKEQLSIKPNTKKGVFEVKVNLKSTEVMNAREGALATQVVIGDDRLFNQQAWTFNKKGTKLSTK